MKTPEQHQEEMLLAIQAELQRLAQTYDTRLLSAAMAMEAGRLLRGLLTAGVWDEKDVTDIMTVSFKDALQPLEQAPVVAKMVDGEMIKHLH